MNPHNSCEVSSVFVITITRTFFLFTLLQLRIVNSMSFCSGSRKSKQVQCQKDQ